MRYDVLMLMLIGFARAVIAEDSDSVSEEAATFASRTMALTDIVLEKHIDPPVRQQMLLGGVKALYQAAKQAVRLSHDGWMSCHSCHTDGHTNGQLNDNLSDGSFGAPKRVLSLLGVAETGPWAWNGQSKSLEEQVKGSINKTMQGAVQSDEQVAALVAYLKTLSRPVVPSNSADLLDADSIRHGKDLFQSLDCQRCHTPPAYTSAGTYDVGLIDSVGNRKFNPPSLRGVGRRVTLFHDGRRDSLEDVFLGPSGFIVGRDPVRRSRSRWQF